MRNKTTQYSTRRDFLRALSRTGLLSGIVFISGFLGWCKIKADPDERTCIYRSPCNSCKKLSNCDDVKAVNFRQKTILKTD